MLDEELLHRRIYVVNAERERIGYVEPVQEPTLDGSRFRKRLEWLGYRSRPGLAAVCVCHFKRQRDAVAYLLEYGPA